MLHVIRVLERSNIPFIRTQGSIVFGVAFDAGRERDRAYVRLYEVKVSKPKPWLHVYEI
ncbi:MAG: hypothetical protein ACP5QP_07590 [Brevinematia bacterium]|jgi:nucleoid-associated protein YgaU